MSDYLATVVEQLRDASDSSGRSMQAAVGWSEIG